MKKNYFPSLFLLMALNLISFFTFSKVISDKNNASQKLSGVTSTTSNAVCSCVVPLDSGFIEVPFNGGMAPYYSCDDGSFGPLALPFTFCYYGDTISSVFINNNGNISFGAPYSMFISSPFPNTNYTMITPFWADIDTRSNIQNSPNGRVRYKLTSSALVVKWDSVGYFPMNGSLKNSFQLTITDGMDTVVKGGNNVSFCYGEMQWTNGGSGLLGTPATVGINKGDGINYFQIARCDHDSTDYDGPYGTNDGISYLDGKSFFISTCTGNGLNIPPIAINDNCDSISFNSPTDSSLISVRFIGPEYNQVVSAQLLPNPNAIVVSNTSGVNAGLLIKVFANATGIYPDLEIVATDNAGATTTQYRHIGNNFSTSIASLQENEVSIYPNPTGAISVLHFTKAGSVTVFNSLGNIVYSALVTANTSSNIDLSKFSTGIYTVQFLTGNSLITKKLIKEY